MPARLLAPLALSVLLALPAAARADEPERLPGYRALQLTAGLGLVTAVDQGDVRVNGSGQGFFGAAEYVLRPSSWFSPRFYGGLLFSKPLDDCGLRPCDVSANYLFAGAKVRLLLPIPWVAPFIEVGAGLSLGQFSTRVGSIVDVYQVGPVVHLPLSIGLVFGEHRGFEVALVYLIHPQLDQISGAFAFGYQFDLD